MNNIKKNRKDFVTHNLRYYETLYDIFHKEEKCNLFIGKVNIEKMTKKGFSTKGGNHGKGLYFAKKIIENSKQFDSESKFIGDYYMQKIIIKKD